MLKSMCVRDPMKKLTNCSLFLLLAVVLACGCSSSNRTPLDNPSDDDLEIVFPLDSVPLISLAPEQGWTAVLNAFFDEGAEDYVRAAFSFDGEELPVVGMRIRGSRKAGKGQEEDKYSLKLNFDYYGGKRFHKVDKVYLENNKPDPSRMREKLASRLYEEMGVPVARVAFVTVELDGENQGLYSMVQAVDKRFLKDKFGTVDNADDGNLYECAPPGCTLEWNGTTKWDYYFPDCDGNECGLVQITNEDDPDMRNYDDLLHFLDVLNNTSDDDFGAAIQQIFDVDRFLRFLAVAVAISDYESYLGDPSNFFLYHRPDTGKFVYIPWDHNKTYGDEECMGSVELTGGDIDPIGCLGPSRPLLTRILAVPAFRQQYLAYLQTVLDQYLTEQVQGAWITELDILVEDKIPSSAHEFHSQEDYWMSISAEPTLERPLSLLYFVKERRAYLLDRLSNL
jgi:spore coat protein CotH